MQPDPLRVDDRPNIPDGPSVYGYSIQNPLAKTDPMGLATLGGGFSSDGTTASEKCQAANDNCRLYASTTSINDGVTMLNCNYLCNNGVKRFTLFVGDWAYPACPPAPPSGAW